MDGVAFFADFSILEMVEDMDEKSFWTPFIFATSLTTRGAKFAIWGKGLK
jgi:hypothetical protein